MNQIGRVEYLEAEVRRLEQELTEEQDLRQHWEAQALRCRSSLDTSRHLLFNSRRRHLEAEERAALRGAALLHLRDMLYRAWDERNSERRRAALAVFAMEVHRPRIYEDVYEREGFFGRPHVQVDQ